jgi:RNA polymerase sigma factor (sigma-70 family)
MQRSGGQRRRWLPGGSRPSRKEVDPAALRLVERHGGQILSTARRYSATVEDAEDAYQRALEILLTKAPTIDESQLVPWLKTVVKHEAFAIRRQRDRSTPTTDDGEPAEPAGAEAATHEQAERYERLRLGAEALRRLKPQEVRCLLLKAEGYSYDEICRITGWTYTKVNRCLTEGRKALVRKVAGIEAGSECERLAPLLSALADGEASAEDLRTLRPHLKSCLTCRARLREFRSVPSRVAVLLPPAVVAAPGGGRVRPVVESLIGAAQDKAAALGERAHVATELATGQKVAAVAASAAALAGGGTAVERIKDSHPPARHHGSAATVAPPARPETTVPSKPPPTEAPPTPQTTPRPPPAVTPPPPSPPPAAPVEFGPDAAPRSAASTSRPPHPSGGGEFGP